MICGEVFTGIERRDDARLLASTSGGKELVADKILMAIGRRPQTEGLGLENAGVETDGKGFIKVDAYSKTSADHIWAVGDVTNKVSLTPVAIHESMCLIETEFKNNPTAPDHDLIATAVFSQPEIGTIGLPEQVAAETYRELEIYRAHFRPMRNTLSGGTDKMLMKIIVDATTDRVVGLHIMGHAAGETAQTLGIAIKMGATKEDFDRTVAVHPTMSEEIVTMKTPMRTA